MFCSGYCILAKTKSCPSMSKGEMIKRRTVSSLEQGRGMTAIFKYLQAFQAGDGAQLLRVVPRDMTRNSCKEDFAGMSGKEIPVVKACLGMEYRRCLKRWSSCYLTCMPPNFPWVAHNSAEAYLSSSRFLHRTESWTGWSPGSFQPLYSVTWPCQ